MSPMPKINLTNKPTSEQVRILKDYLSRRSQHQGQGDIKLSQVVKRFKHKSLMSDKDKMAHFRKLLKLTAEVEGTKKEEKK
jgi:hypothetical protein